MQTWRAVTRSPFAHGECGTPRSCVPVPRDGTRDVLGSVLAGRRQPVRTRPPPGPRRHDFAPVTAHRTAPGGRQRNLVRAVPRPLVGVACVVDVRRWMRLSGVEHARPRPSGPRRVPGRALARGSHRRACTRSVVDAWVGFALAAGTRAILGVFVLDSVAAAARASPRCSVFIGACIYALRGERSRRRRARHSGRGFAGWLRGCSAGALGCSPTGAVAVRRCPGTRPGMRRLVRLSPARTANDSSAPERARRPGRRPFASRSARRDRHAPIQLRDRRIRHPRGTPSIGVPSARPSRAERLAIPAPCPRTS